MSRYTTYVLVSGSTCYVPGRVDHMMAPYNNAFEVEEYETECSCNWNRDGYNPDCEECKGAGRYLTTMNPMAKFDEYGVVDYDHKLRHAAKDPSELPDDAALAPLRSLDTQKLKLPHVVVTPDGDWHEMDGDWYAEKRDSADWKKWGSLVREIYGKYPNAILVVLSCHR